jgi:hypothetical protein
MIFRWLSKFLKERDYITKLRRAQAEVISNHANTKVRGNGQEEAISPATFQLTAVSEVT